MTSKTYSEACDRNRGPILSVISPLLFDCHALLEIGSGNGQHAVYFAEKMPHLIWYTSDVMENHPDIKAWVGEAGLSNIRDPLLLDVKQDVWPEPEIDAVFSANTVHIMNWDEVMSFFSGVGRSLSENGKFLLYGPINYNQTYTSESNARFDVWLKARDPESGIRDFELLDEFAENAGMELIEDYEMPANNRILYWRKTR